MSGQWGYLSIDFHIFVRSSEGDAGDFCSPQEG